MKNIILSQINKDELITEILNGVASLIEQSRTASIAEKVNWTAQETATFLKVSKVTIHEWTKKGILKKYKIGNRIFYKKVEVLKSINRIEH